MQKSRAISFSLVFLAAAIAFGSILGCSGDSTVVVEGDPEARRKKKADALEKTLYPNGKPAGKAAKRKGA